MTRRRGRRNRRGAKGPGHAREWIGGTATAPFYVHDRAEPYRPEIALWLELPDDFVVGMKAATPEEAEDAVALTLREALAAPAVGPPRRPASIRVADAETAAQVRDEVGTDTPVIVGPLPELDKVFDGLFEAMAEQADREPSYLEEGRIPIAAVEAFFNAAGVLFAIKPWDLGDNPPVLRMDIPELGVDGACAVIIGQHGENRGVLVFPSLDRFEAFTDAAEAADLKGPAISAVSDLLALTFESAADLPATMRHEAMKHGWRVRAPDAYPCVQCHDQDGLPRPLLERDLEIATAYVEALCAFLVRHAEVLSASIFDPICESYFDNDDREVRVTVPCDALEHFDLDSPKPVEPFRQPEARSESRYAPESWPATEGSPGWHEPPEPFRPRTARNAPCPCGSGRKYKKCCLRDDEARHGESLRGLAAHRMDARLVDDLADFARGEFGEAWRTFRHDLESETDSGFLTHPLSVYTFATEGRTLVDAYLEAHGQRCVPTERRWLDAQRAAWLSVWEVEAVVRGRSVTLLDLLSGERRKVSESTGSRELKLRDALLARVVDYDGLSLLAGIHAIPLAPYDAAWVVDRARAHLRRKRAVPVERLRAGSFAPSLIRYWEDAIEELQERSAQPPKLLNRDDDPLLLTVDRFEVAAEAMAEVDGLIGQLEGAVRETTDDGATTWAFLRAEETLPDGQRTVIGWVRLDSGTLTIDTNSETRADALRNRIEDACGPLVHHRRRHQTNPLALGPTERKRAVKPARSTPEERRFAAEHKARHYKEWLDMPVPALDGRTPRETSRTAAGRKELDLLLKHMENMEHRAGGEFDFSVIREELKVQAH